MKYLTSRSNLRYRVISSGQLQTFQELQARLITGERLGYFIEPLEGRNPIILPIDGANDLTMTIDYAQRGNKIDRLRFIAIAPTPKPPEGSGTITWPPEQSDDSEAPADPEYKLHRSGFNYRDLDATVADGYARVRAAMLPGEDLFGFVYYGTETDGLRSSITLEDHRSFDDFVRMYGDQRTSLGAGSAKILVWN
jgi:hypothetical protein